ncbi:MAG TPA: NUDIX domain-containing protein [Cyclobacteriaceae bacterium]|nr:NUDIX domain-containing protein [Cyclobacteriaceae bacterium]
MQPTIHLSVDAVIFGYDPDDGISVLLIKRNIDPYKGWWALPGGLVKTHESLEHAVRRELKEETGIEVQYLEQLYTFGETDRDPRNRTVTVAYYGLVRPKNFRLVATTDADDAKWFNVKQLPRLAFDHKDILDTAIARLRGKLAYEPIGFELLDQKFPFSDLEKLYQTVLDQELDRRNFKKKIMAYGFLEETKEIRKATGAGRPAALFRFNKKRYEELVKRGYNFDLFY